MSDLQKELTRESIEQLLRELFEEAFLQCLPLELRLQGIPPEQRVKGLSVDDLMAALSPEMRAAIAKGFITEQTDSGNPAEKNPGVAQ